MDVALLGAFFLYRGPHRKSDSRLTAAIFVVLMVEIGAAQQVASPWTFSAARKLLQPRTYYAATGCEIHPVPLATRGRH